MKLSDLPSFVNVYVLDSYIENLKDAAKMVHEGTANRHFFDSLAVDVVLASDVDYMDRKAFHEAVESLYNDCLAVQGLTK